ncbi:hypothetical protein ACIBKX_37375 [Streptomyces sp. NPDC050658]|uniref:hypothetical protein n=1 Tax=unclassified Streptomyces TaxID=2593676 RepID=UPI0034348F69
MTKLRSHRIRQEAHHLPLVRAATSAFSESLDEWRKQARTDWRDLRGPIADTLVPAEIPPYLLDRYAFRAHMQAQFGVRTTDRFSRPFAPQAAKWVESTRKLLRGAPSVGLTPVRLEDPVPDTPLLRDLLRRWREYLSSLGLAYSPELFQQTTAMTWLELYQESVLYPFYPPAINGPSFMERISGPQRRDILERHGRSGIMSLYTFLLKAHEDTHRAQKGDPLVCEYILAMLWCRFLDENDLWYWERDEETHVALNVEEPYLRRVHIEDATLCALFHDTAAGARDTLGPYAYDELCLTGWLFDAGVIGYHDYLELTTRRLCGTSLRFTLSSLLLDLDTRLAHPTFNPSGKG